MLLFLFDPTYGLFARTHNLSVYYIAVFQIIHIDRGYAGLWEVLASLGGRIGREMPPLDAAVKKIPSKKQIHLAFGAKR